MTRATETVRRQTAWRDDAADELEESAQKLWALGVDESDIVARAREAIAEVSADTERLTEHVRLTNRSRPTRRRCRGKASR
jgi:hypothetical protein